MISYNYTDKEIRDEMLAEQHLFHEYISKVYDRPEFQRRARKARRFPYLYKCSFKTTKGNRYYLVLKVQGYDKRGVDVLSMYYTTFNSPEGIYGVRCDIVRKDSIVFTPHFFARYRQRFLKDEKLKPAEVVESFMERNFDIVTKYSDNGKVVGGCADGFIISKLKDGGINIAMTFVSRDILYSDQKSDLDFVNEVINQFLEKLNKEEPGTRNILMLDKYKLKWTASLRA